MIIKIPDTRGWTQVDGDMNPGAYGGTIANADGHAIELMEIQPTREYVGDREAMDVGFPFWTRTGYYLPEDLDPHHPEVEAALRYVGFDPAELLDTPPTDRAMIIACACLHYGHLADEGPAGFAEDIIPGRVKWFASERRRGPRFFADEDREFRALMREHSKCA